MDHLICGVPSQRVVTQRWGTCLLSVIEGTSALVGANTWFGCRTLQVQVQPPPPPRPAYLQLPGTVVAQDETILARVDEATNRSRH